MDGQLLAGYDSCTEKDEDVHVDYFYLENFGFLLGEIKYQIGNIEEPEECLSLEGGGSRGELEILQQLVFFEKNKKNQWSQQHVVQNMNYQNNKERASIPAHKIGSELVKLLRRDFLLVSFYIVTE